MKKHKFVLASVMIILLSIQLFSACGKVDDDVPSQKSGSSVTLTPKNVSAKTISDELIKIGYVDYDEFWDQYENLSDSEIIDILQKNGITGTMYLDDDVDPASISGCTQAAYYDFERYLADYRAWDDGGMLVYLKFESEVKAADYLEDAKEQALSDEDYKCKFLENSIILSESWKNGVGTVTTDYYRISQKGTVVLFYETSDFSSPYTCFEDDPIYKMFDEFGF